MKINSVIIRNRRLGKEVKILLNIVNSKSKSQKMTKIIYFAFVIHQYVKNIMNKITIF